MFGSSSCLGLGLDKELRRSKSTGLGGFTSSGSTRATAVHFSGSGGLALTGGNLLRYTGIYKLATISSLDFSV